MNGPNTIITAKTLLHALVGIDYALSSFYSKFLVDACPEEFLLEKEDGFLYAGNAWWNKAGKKDIESYYQKAVDEKFFNPKLNENEKTKFINKKREYQLVEIDEGKPGFLGINSTPYKYQLVPGEKCYACGEEYEWIYLPGNHKSAARPNHCLQRKICKKCGAKPVILSSRFTHEHQFERVISKEKNCRVLKKCVECGYEIDLHRTEHDFSDWSVSKNNPCALTRKCAHCGLKENKEEHLGEWVQIDDKELSDNTILYTYERTCTRCGKVEQRSEPFFMPS